MNISKIFMPSSIGLILLAIISSFGAWNNSNIWVAISAIFLLLSLIVFIIRTSFSSIDERLKKIEEQIKKQ